MELEALDPAIAGVGQTGQNIALVHETFIKGEASNYATFKQATETHCLRQRILKAPDVHD